MEKFFQTQAVDDFFENPNEVVEFANTLDFKIGPHGFWPGKRTLGLHMINHNFFNSVLQKIFTLFFDYKHTNINWDNVEMYFQKTYPYDPKNKKSLLNSGLIHQDGNFPLVGLVYLTKNADLDSGTSIFLPKKLEKNYEKKTSILSSRKEKLYKKPLEKMTKKDLADYEVLVNDVNSNFNETTRFNNVYNRLITYNGNEYHKCNSFFTGEKERLTLVFFVGQIQSSSFYPIQKLNSIKTNFSHDNTEKKHNKKRNSKKN